MKKIPDRLIFSVFEREEINGKTQMTILMLRPVALSSHFWQFSDSFLNSLLQENIGQFGGDPESVTLMGHGTGAALSGLLLLSPVSIHQNHPLR